jgi:hypothetical protein
MRTEEHCPRCRDTVPVVLCVERDERVARCAAHHHVLKREPLNADPIEHHRLDAWIRRLERGEAVRF